MSDLQYFEDIAVGAKASFGHYAVTRDEVIEFARKYDPQPFHLSDEAAAATHFGRLSASGWHTCAMTMAMLVEHMKHHRQAGLGSPGIDQLQWRKPVYPGDTLRCESEVLEKRVSASRPEMGIYKSRMTVQPGRRRGDDVRQQRTGSDAAGHLAPPAHYRRPRPPRPR